MRQTKTRVISWLLMLAMVFSLISPGALQRVSAEESKPFDGYVYVTVEKFTLGQGFAQEPLKVGYYEEENLETVLKRGLGDKLIMTDSSYGAYMTGYEDGGEPEGWNTDQIPAQIMEKLEADQTSITARADDKKSLEQGDYTGSSAYSFCVDNISAQFGMSGIAYEADTEDGKSYHDNSVIRIQYGIYNWGADLNTYYIPDSRMIDFPDKDDLIEIVADYNADKENAVYKEAVTVLEDWDATEEEVENAQESLKEYLTSKLSDQYEEILTRALANRKAECGTPSYGYEWVVLAQARNGNTDDKWYHNYYHSVEQTAVASENNLIGKSVTDNARTIIALTAMGMDPSNVGGKNLLEPLADFSNIQNQYVTCPVYVLIALDCGNYEIPETEVATKTTREQLIATILNNFLSEGYIGYEYGGVAYDDLDSTAMALQALAPYYGTNEDVKTTVDQTLTYLAQRQNANGTFGDYDVVCTTAQVICALSALGIDVDTDEHFLKKDISMLDAMLSYADENGNFAVAPYGSSMSTEQAGYALVAYDRHKKNQSGLYAMAEDGVDADAFYKCADAKVTITGAKEPTCTEDGYTGDKCCDICGALFEEGTVIEKKGHTVVVDPAVEPTEDKEGRTEGSHCSVCNTVIKKQEVLPKKEKQPQTPATTAEPTTTTEQPAVNTQAASDGTSVTPKVLKKPVISKVKSTKKNQMKVTLKVSQNISGYQIQVSTSSKFKNAKNYNVKKSVLNKTIKGLKSGKKYYVRTRTYKKTGAGVQTQTIYSKWSKVQKVKVK